MYKDPFPYPTFQWTQNIYIYINFSKKYYNFSHIIYNVLIFQIQNIYISQILEFPPLIKYLHLSRNQPDTCITNGRTTTIFSKKETCNTLEREIARVLNGTRARKSASEWEEKGKRRERRRSRGDPIDARDDGQEANLGRWIREKQVGQENEWLGWCRASLRLLPTRMTKPGIFV